MPRKQKYTQSLESLLDFSPSKLESMTRKDLAQVVTRMRDAGQKRMNRIEKSGVYSPSAEYIKRTGGFETIRGKDLAQLRNEYIRLRGFLSKKTSTVKGTKIYQKRQQEIIAEQAGVTVSEIKGELTSEQWGKVWSLIDRASDSGVVDRANYKKFVSHAVESIRNNDPDDKDAIYKDFISAIEEEYKKEIEDDVTKNISSYFE